MSSAGDGQDREPEPDGVLAEVRKAWREFKRLVGALEALVDGAGEAVLDARRLVRRAAGIASRYSGRIAMLIAAVGVSAPLTNDTANPLASAGWDGWARTSALVALAWALYSALRWGMGRHAPREGAAQSTMGRQPLTKPVERLDVAGSLRAIETLEETYSVMRAGDRPELLVGQRRWTRRMGEEAIAPVAVVTPPGRPGKAPEPPV